MSSLFPLSFFKRESAPGIVLIVLSLVALVIANSPLGTTYTFLLHANVGPLSLEGWVNDVLMSVFFLVVGLEIKREMVVGELASWAKRLLPGIAALAGMVVPALIFVAFNWGHGSAQGWAIPSATDIAFSLGIVSLLGSRVPRSLKLFLTALAIIDDLGAVLVIGLFYTPHVNVLDLVGALAVFICLCLCNLVGVRRLWPYLLLGIVLWCMIYGSGIHPTLAGVLLALTIPLSRSQQAPHTSPLHRLEHLLSQPTSFFILPIFALANAGVSIIGVDANVLVSPITLGVTCGLVAGKTLGIFGVVNALVKTRWVAFPHGANQRQLLGVCILCGIGFTMSLFISLLAFQDASAIAEAKIGILLGSFIAGVGGYMVLRHAHARHHQTSDSQ
ncbi:Na(+)/H(+) antiporter NhaA [Halomonadaceae bacterium LMG 33818]|uniref:Na+/H+ antiporter NhaA n=1 Tax=Cernens ardua TaxID=3402176 RepID=UPI003EDB6D01